MTKDELAGRGRERLLLFCRVNDIDPPGLRESELRSPFRGSCAYYRPTYVQLYLKSCASPGTAGRCWSWPGYVIDRTPFGVYQHELGHHMEHLHGGYAPSASSVISAKIHELSGEPAITGYAPNISEWFAEMFRLFVTNPELLMRLRPRAYEEMERLWKRAEDRHWNEVLGGAPQRTLDMAEKKIRAAGAVP